MGKMKFEIGERVQVIIKGKLLEAKVIEYDLKFLLLCIELPNGSRKLVNEDNIAKLDQPKPTEVPEQVSRLLDTYLIKKEPLDDFSRGTILADILDDYSEGVLVEDWELADDWIRDNHTKLVDAVRNGYVVEESPKTHSLKILPEYFDAIDHGVKTFEIRKNDRNFKVGDVLILREYDEKQYTGSELKAKITYITAYAQQDGYVVLGIEMEVSE